MQRQIPTTYFFGKELNFLYFALAKKNKTHTIHNNMFKLLKKSILALFFILPFTLLSQKAEATH